MFLVAFGEWRCGMDEQRMCIYSPANQVKPFILIPLTVLSAHHYLLIPPVFSHMS